MHAIACAENYMACKQNATMPCSLVFDCRIAKRVALGLFQFFFDRLSNCLELLYSLVLLDTPLIFRRELPTKLLQVGPG